MNAKTFFAVLTILGLLVSCAQVTPQPENMVQAARIAKTSADHKALAKYYEDAAGEMEAKVQEHKKLLEEYEVNSYHYGKQAQDLQAHCRGLVRYYEQAEKANLSMADIHRKMSAEAK